MKRFFTSLFVAWLILLGPLIPEAEAQKISTAGKEFWAGFMYNTIGGADPVLRLRISSKVATNGMVSIPRIGYTQAFAVVPGAVTTVDIAPAALAHVKSSEKNEPMGILITTQDTCYVFSENYIQFTTDASLVLPTTALGNEYMVMSYQTFVSEFLVVATEDNTVIEITPTAQTQGGRAAGTAFTATLQRGDAYQVRTIGGGTTNARDLTGSIVKSLDACKPIAVLGGNECANVPIGFTTCDHIYEQLYPTYTWGKEYLTVPFKTRGRDYFRILARDNNTLVRINGAPPITLNSGKMHDFGNNIPNHIVANKPVSVCQYSAGDAYDGNDDNGDPFMLLITPVEQRINNITFSIIIPGNDVHFTNVYTATGNVPSMTLNGANVGASFAPVPGQPNLSYAQLDLPIAGGTVTDFTLKGTEGFNASVYGFGFDNSYGYSAGGYLNNLSFDFTFPDTVCLNAKVLFNDTIPFNVSDVQWDFGDGNTSTQRDPIHAYTTGGTFTVTLKVRQNTCQEWFVLSKKILVRNEALNSSVSADTTICRGDTATLRATGGNKYLWSPGMTLSAANKAVVKARPLNKTTYQVLVTDTTKGCFSTHEVTVDVVGLPVAAFTYDLDSLTVRFKGTDSLGIYEWYWDFGDRSVPSTEKNPTHVYVQMDSFLVTLVVVSPCGRDTIKWWIHVQGGKGTGGTNGILERVEVATDLHMWPVPVKDLLHLQLHGQRLSGAEVLIYNASGRSVWSGLAQDHLVDQTLELNVRDIGLKSGLYGIQVRTGSGSLYRPFLVE